MNAFEPVQLRERSDGARRVLALAFIVLVASFFRVQVVQHARFELRAETNRLRPVPQAAPRGAILDRKGEVIAENVPGYSVKLLNPSTDSMRAILGRMATVVPLDSGDIATVLARHRQGRYVPAVVFGDASFETIARLEEHRAMLPGLVIQSEPKRQYPAGRAVAHVVGYVGEVTEQEIDDGRFGGAQLGSIVGRAGLERSYDDTLRGRSGERYVEVNARGGLVRDDAGASLPPVAGTPIRTTIDLDLQRYVDSIWPAGVRGALVAMTPDGQVRALYSAPTYNPNDFVGGIDAEQWRALNADSATPLLNRAIVGRYPPASPFKLAIAAMALRRGIITMNTRMPQSCTGGIRLGNRVFKCWKKEGHGSLDLVGAVAASCDVYFYQLGTRLGLPNIIEDGSLFGFGDRSGIDLPSEQTPIFPSSTAYFDRRYGPRNWSPPATTFNFSIGQGENTQTLINMVRFYEALAGDGQLVTPRLVMNVARGPAPARRSLGLTEAQLAGLRSALVAVVERGTAAASRRADLKVAGKTGTAQNPHGKDHGWFIGFAPADKPELVVGAIMEFAQHGTTVAPYVVRVLDRYVNGPGRSGGAMQLLVPVDSAPRMETLPRDSSAVPAAPATAAAQ